MSPNIRPSETPPYRWLSSAMRCMTVGRKTFSRPGPTQDPRGAPIAFGANADIEPAVSGDLFVAMQITLQVQRNLDILQF
jgi:hypothetical protein